MEHQLPELPYAKDALAPHISAETIEYHYGKHHKAYVDNINRLTAGTEFEEMSLEDIIQKSSGGIFNNADHVVSGISDVHFACDGVGGQVERLVERFRQGARDG